MNTSKRVLSVLLAVVVVTLAVTHPPQLPAQTAAAMPSGGHNSSTAAQWSVQVDRVDPGEVNLASSFQIAIYENLLDELGKTKRFKQVLREGDRNASDVSNLLILKNSGAEVHPRKRDSTRGDHRKRRYKVNRPQSTVHTKRPGHTGTHHRRQCPLSGKQPASDAQSGPQCRQGNRTVIPAGASALSFGTGWPVIH